MPGLITETTITALHSLPPGLRTAAIIGMFKKIEGMTAFADGLRILAARAGLPFGQLAKAIAALGQSNQVIAKIKQIVDSLPPLGTLLPVQVGGFRRLDTVAEIRNLAKTWSNCLADHLPNVNDGTTAIYLCGGPGSCLFGRSFRPDGLVFATDQRSEKCRHRPWPARPNSCCLRQRRYTTLHYNCSDQGYRHGRSMVTPIMRNLMTTRSSRA